MAVAFIALLVALGGTSYAATKLAKDSVGSRELKRNAVTRVDIKNGAVTGAKIANGSITGADLKMAALGQIPAAVKAANADNAGHAGSAGAVDKVTYRGVAASVGAAGLENPTDLSSTITTTASASAGCDPGQVVVGGGVKVDDPDSLATHDSYPDSARAWTATVGNDDPTAAHSFSVFAICVAAGTIG
jgi:hypothetical protein